MTNHLALTASSQEHIQEIASLTPRNGLAKRNKAVKYQGENSVQIGAKTSKTVPRPQISKKSWERDHQSKPAENAEPTIVEKDLVACDTLTKQFDKKITISESSKTAHKSSL